MWKNNKFRGNKGKKRKYYTQAEKDSYYAGLRAGKRIARSRRTSSKGRY